jgi:hypothetical protein
MSNAGASPQRSIAVLDVSFQSFLRPVPEIMKFTDVGMHKVMCDLSERQPSSLLGRIDHRQQA